MLLYIVPCLQQNLQKEIHPGASPYSMVKGFREFSRSIGACAASWNWSKGLEKMLLDGVVIVSAIVVVFSFLLTWPSNMKAFSMYGAFYIASND